MEKQDQINSSSSTAPSNDSAKQGYTQAQIEQKVLESISKLEDGRKCWRLINGVLMEKTKLDVVPEMRVVINNLNSVMN